MLLNISLFSRALFSYIQTFQYNITFQFFSYISIIYFVFSAFIFNLFAFIHFSTILNIIFTFFSLAPHYFLPLHILAYHLQTFLYYILLDRF